MRFSCIYIYSTLFVQHCKIVIFELYVALQETDLRHLVENVWNSQSALSAWDDLYDLVLVRWDAHDEWSPWNCVLLTKEEASAHEKLENLEEVSERSCDSLCSSVFID